MERYEAYKDSGVEWIGEIPAGWGVNKLGNLGRYINGYAFKPDQWGDEGLPIIRIQDLTGSNDSPNYYSGKIDEKYLVSKGDLLVSWAATIGVYWWTRNPGWLNQHIFRVIPLKGMCDKQFFYWMLNAAIDALDNENKHGIMMEHLTLAVFNAFKVPLPSMREQHAIADYLDAKTAEIDALVADCEREVGLLREYRKAVISEAVTKGLDPYAPMKDSGVEWIGEIPEGWVIVPFKAIGTVAANLQHPANYPDLPQVSPDRIEKDSGRLLPCFSVAEVGVESDNHVFHAGDILYSKVRPALNKVTVAPFDGMCSADMYPIESSQNKRWFVFYMLSNAFMEQVIVSTDRVKMPKINKEELGAFKVVLPSADEQCEIAVYLDAKTAEIDSLIEAKQQMADKLREYRKSLISEAVTGKFKVQGVR